jgi:hypothetical protein
MKSSVKDQNVEIKSTVSESDYLIQDSAVY